MKKLNKLKKFRWPKNTFKRKENVSELKQKVLEVCIKRKAHDSFSSGDQNSFSFRNLRLRANSSCQTPSCVTTYQERIKSAKIYLFKNN